MYDNVQAKPSASSPTLFHSSLIKLLVLEELNKIGKTWESFLASNNYEVILPSPSRPTPRIKRPTSQRIATPVPTSPPIQAPTPTHTPQPISKTPEVALNTYPSMSEGNRKEVKTYLKKRNKVEAF